MVPDVASLARAVATLVRLLSWLAGLLRMSSSPADSAAVAGASGAASSSNPLLISGLWVGASVPDEALKHSVPVNPICWSLTLMPKSGGPSVPNAFGGGFFDDAGDVPGMPVLIFTLAGTWDPDSSAVKFQKMYVSRNVPESLTVEYEGVVAREPDGAFSIKGTWVNALEGTYGSFACRREQES